ncbi:ThiF family adenylyltransferase [Streptococcus danieliae]|uniref:ThiF family adenylyltransferase n=1 Tax=Streptococcus danieliae TaxID=747656 RepID=UPI0021C7A687|nr:ThiF family adenylyltransferase [Streptococcus danieliae]MCU0082888.1 ThiF family adenylyltransferase [Streptococcus danieliae]
MYRLKEAVVYFRKGEYTVLQHGKKRWSILDQDSSVFSYLSKNELIKDTDNEYVNFLITENLVTTVVEYPKDKFIKNRYYFENIQKGTSNSFQSNFNTMTVLILGLGGIGTVVLSNLIAMGVKNFILIDGDTVDVSNLNRQLFFDSEDIGKSKVEIVAQKALAIDSDINIKTLKCFIKTKHDIESLKHYKFDLLVNAADTPNNLISLILNNLKSFPFNFITSGVGLDSGMFSTIITAENHSIAAQYFTIDSGKEIFPILKASISPTNMLIGSFVSNEILKFYTHQIKEEASIHIFSFSDYSLEREFII